MDRGENSDNLKGQPDAVNESEREVQTIIIPVIEEKLLVGKKNIKKGTIRVNKKVIEEEVNAHVFVEEEELDVKRVAVNRYVVTHPAIRQEGETTIVPVMREVIEKRLVLVEELHITKRKVKKNRSQKLSLRKDKINIEYKKEPGSDFNDR
jgi:uncharacterized protein (TIGR02271 family)